MAIEYVRVSEAQPCPVCGRPDWCLIHISGRHIICARVKSEKKVGNRGAGWLHNAGKKIDVDVTKVSTSVRVDPKEVMDFSNECERQFTDRRAAALSEELGLPVSSLRTMSFGWCEEQEAYTTPMRDPSGQIVGVQFRRGPAKWFYKGSRMGLFIPKGWRRRQSEPLFFPEGASDSTAFISIGLFAVGRPNNRVGVADVREFVDRNPRWVRGIPSAVIVADHDKINPTTGKREGLEGALDLAFEVPGSIVIEPLEVKDARQAVLSGCTRKDVLSVVERKSSVFWRGVALDRRGMV